MSGSTQFVAHCRSCNSKLVSRWPQKTHWIEKKGIHVRCAECGQTEWATKPDDIERGPETV